MDVSKLNLIGESRDCQSIDKYILIAKIAKAIHDPSNNNLNHKYIEPAFHKLNILFKFENFYDDIDIYVYSIFKQNGGCRVFYDRSKYGLITLATDQDEDYIYLYAKSNVNNRYVAETYLLSSDNPSYVTGYYYETPLYNTFSNPLRVQKINTKIINGQNFIESINANECVKIATIDYKLKNNSLGGKCSLKIVYMDGHFYSNCFYSGSIECKVVTSTPDVKRIYLINNQVTTDKLYFKVGYVDNGTGYDIYIINNTNVPINLTYKLESSYINNIEQCNITMHNNLSKVFKNSVEGLTEGNNYIFKGQLV